jgi:hypothetical protein
MSDLNHQDVSSPQSKLQPNPVTIAAAATIVPTTLLTVVTGTTPVDNITPFTTGTHVLYIVHTDNSPGTYGTGGNVVNAVIPTKDVPCTFIYNPVTAKYYGWANNVT